MQMTGKNNRILDLYARLMNGEPISKRECAGKYGVNEKSVQRDFNDIRSYFAMKLSEEGCGQVLVYDRKEGGYRLETQGNGTISSIKSEYDENGNLSETMVNITYIDENGINHRTKVYIDAE